MLHDKRFCMEKADILAGCKHLFGKWGIHRVNMAEVSKHFGISKKTLYKIYDNKDAIVMDYVKYLIDESRTELKRRMDEAGTEVRVSVFNGFIVEKFITMGIVLFYEIKKYHPSAFDLLKKYKHELIAFLNDLLKDGQKAGIFRSEINTRVFAELRIDLLEWEIMEVKKSPGTVASNQKLLFDLMLNGLKEGNH